MSNKKKLPIGYGIMILTVFVTLIAVFSLITTIGPGKWECVEEMTWYGHYETEELCDFYNAKPTCSYEAETVCIKEVWTRIPKGYEEMSGDKIEEINGCFYDWQLHFECSQNNGTIMPLMKKGIPYWTCSTLNYEVPRC